MKVYRDIVDNSGNITKTPIFNIMEGTYSGKDMGERSISATIEFPTPIDFHAGDYVEFDIADLIRGENVEGGHFLEKFYIYTMPTIKKVASSMSVGNAFEHTVTFYPRQYELGCMQMRDALQQVNSGIIYTGYDEFSFYGGAKTLIDRVIAVLNERFPKSATGVAGVDYWDYRISDSVNEERNTALEKFQFDFSGNSVMDAILKLNDENGINTKFWINERMIYIGFKRPYVCGVDSANVLRTIPFDFKYGKTSHLPISTNYGNLFTITKSLGSNSPITRLYAYGADRNLHRFYCSDRIKSGRYVNHLMLPSFGNDGKTDYIDSVEGIAKFGIREGSKTFDEIYPSLRYFTYGDIRSVKYCIKIMGSGVEPDSSQYESGKTYQYPIARVQCYKVEPLAGTKVNHLVQSAPPVDLAVFCHATGKTVKVILYAAKDGKTALQRQQEAAGKWDNGNFRVPAQTLHGTNYIAGAAFAIHDENYPCAHTHEKYSGSIGAKKQDDSGKPLTRDDWFVDADKIEIHDGEEKVVNPAKEKYKNEVSIHQIHYTDTHWITDIFEFTSYDQTTFQRQGYSAYCWARINNTYPESMSDSIEVNQVVDVPAVVIEDTDLNSTDGSNQQYWEIFTRDMGFKINEQTWFGDYVFLFGNCTVNFLDGNLGGYGFTCPKENDSKKVQEIYIPALDENGQENKVFFEGDKYVSAAQCRKAYEQGAYWRILLQRADTDIANYWMPNISVNGNAGDHFVFLDIYMPDIYQRVAERRLEKEARKYLDANDDGDIQYSFDFDKVRMIQVPAFGLQMREGAIMRVVDDDLDVKTLNSAKTIFQQTSGLVSRKTVYQTTYTESSQEKVYYTEQHRDIDYFIEQGIVKIDEKTNKILKGDSAPITHKLYFSKDPTVLLNGIHIDAPAEWICISDEDLSDTTGEPFAPTDGVNVRIVERKTENSNFVYYLTDLYFTLNAKNIRHNNSGQYLVDLSYHSQYGVLPKWYEDRDGKFLLGIVEYDMHYPHTYDETIYTPNTNLRPQGSRFFCPSQQLTEFKANKYYEVTMDCENTAMPFFDKNGMRTLFALLNNLGDYASWFVPEYIAEEITDFDGSDKWRRFVFKFTLDETFNDSQDYYPAIQYISDGNTEEVSVRLISIIESDAGGLKELNYADLNIDTITIKFHDNTREHGVSLQNGIEPSRRVGNTVSPMIREISATVKEESRASAWAQMMSRIEDNEILGDQVIRTQEQIANAARRRYRELLALRDSIFDPDGTCDQTFLHIMMLQIGADSMNYQLDKTHQSANGNVLSNCRIDRVANNNDTFSVLSEDILRHYVFTEDEPQGLWYVAEPAAVFDLAQVADEDETLYYPTYFVAIKCAIHDSRSAVWVCEPTQHKVNEDSEYYYFNWGILNPDAEGHYSLIETRGNAYMYGDNLVCGKISTLAGQSYFDLTHGNFVLSDGTTKALSYENGILTIGGINDGDADSVLAKLGIIEKTASSAQSAADDAKADAAAAQAALDNLEIGGRNLLTGTSSALRKVTAGSNTVWGWRIPESNTYIALEPNTTYTARMYIENHMTNIDARIYIITSKTGKYNNQSDLTEFEPNHNKFPERFRIRPNQNGYSEITFTTLSDTVSGFVMVRFNTTGSTSVTTVTTAAGDYINYSKVKIEKGNKATDWTPAPEDVEASIAESKTYTEGLVTALGDTLQSQIDGVVDSYFMEGVPTTSNAPANEWTTDELKKRHEGDTYTNIQQYTKLGAGIWESGAIGVGSAYKNKAYADCKYNMATSIRTKELLTNQPNQLLYVPSGYTVLVSRFDSNGKYIGSYVESATSFTLPTDAAQIAIQLRASSNISADIADTLGLCINPDAGKSWRWCKGTGDSPATGWHWHEIADSDAVRALQSAAKAQDTADGKRRVFVVQPTPPYEIGDLWAQGSGDGKDILKCKTAKAAGQTFAQDDWESASSALTAAQAAQNSVDNMVIGGENVYTGNDKQMIINGEDAYGDEAETFRFNYFYTLEARTTVVVTAKLENDDLLSGVNHLYVVAIPYGTSGLTEKNNILWKDGNDNYNVELTYLSSIKIYDLGTPIGSTTKLLLYFFAKDDKGDLGSLYPDDGIVYARRIMVQKGNKATAYQPYVEHLTAALKGSTEVAGGLVMTDVLLLKDEKKQISAGMSGLSDNVTMWGGGSYENAVKQANGLMAELSKLLPVLITKQGVGSNIGCFKVLNEHAVEVNGSNGDKIVIDSNDNGCPSISVIKDDNVVTRISSEVLNKKKITLKRYTKIEYTDSTRVQIYTTNGAVNSRVNVSNSTLGLSVNQLYGLTFNATNVEIYVKLYSPNNYYNLSNFKISFNLYLNNTLLSSVSETVASQSIGSTGQMIVVHTNLITSTKNITITSSGADILNIRNVSVSGQYNGNTYLVSSYLYGISFGFGMSESSFVDGSIDFVDSDGVTNTIIGSNGIIVKGERGGFVQILNSENQIYFRATGLPNDKTTKDSGQVCVKNTDTSRDAFIDAFKNWAANYIQAKSGFSAALAKVLDAVPKYDSLLGIEE